jgi:glucan 1,3-beta-glucosidase
MSNNNPLAHNVAYDPLPLTNDDYPNNLYNGPPSPDPGLSMFHTPQMDPRELGPDENAIPPGAAQPRFLGAAFYNASDSPSMRNSLASLNHTIPGTQSEYNSSLYTLNDPQVAGGNYHDDPRDLVSGRALEGKRAAYSPRTKSTRKIMIVAIIVALALIIAAVVIPLYLFVIKPSHSNINISKATASINVPTPSTSASSGGSSNVRVTGGNGSVITLENGTTFTYQNPFGGYWYWDENDPFNRGARAQSWSPALNETFNYGVDKVRGSVF